MLPVLAASLWAGLPRTDRLGGYHESVTRSLTGPMTGA